MTNSLITRTNILAENSNKVINTLRTDINEHIENMNKYISENKFRHIHFYCVSSATNITSTPYNYAYCLMNDITKTISTGNNAFDKDLVSYTFNDSYVAVLDSGGIIRCSDVSKNTISYIKQYLEETTYQPTKLVDISEDGKLIYIYKFNGIEHFGVHTISLTEQSTEEQNSAAGTL